MLQLSILTTALAGNVMVASDKIIDVIPSGLVLGDMTGTLYRKVAQFPQHSWSLAVLTGEQHSLVGGMECGRACGLRTAKYNSWAFSADTGTCSLANVGNSMSDEFGSRAQVSCIHEDRLQPSLEVFIKAEEIARVLSTSCCET